MPMAMAKVKPESRRRVIDTETPNETRWASVSRPAPGSSFSLNSPRNRSIVLSGDDSAGSREKGDWRGRYPRRMGITLFLSVWVATNAYIAWRVSSVPWVARHVPAWALSAVTLLLATSYVLARMLYAKGPRGAGLPFEILGATWIGVAFYLLLFLLLVDLVTGFGFFAPRLAPSLRGGALVFGAIVSLAALLNGLRPPAVREYEVVLKGLPAGRDGTRIALLSDLHLGSLVGESWLEARLAQVEAMRPDVIVLVGDIVEGDGRDDVRLVSILGRFSAPLGVFAVTGNHEYYGGVEPAVASLKRAGFRVLRDEWVEPVPGLVLAGVDDLTARWRFGHLVDHVDAALKGIPPGRGVVLLSHSPLQAGRAAKDGAGLMLSGHTHDGQIWPFGFISRVRYPLHAGRYEVGGMTAIVCRGTGTWGPRMRLFHRSEIVLVTLLTPERKVKPS